MCKPTEKEVKNAQNKYALVIGVAKRAREITEEYEKNFEILVEKPVLLASEEFKEKKIIIKPNKADDK